MSNYSDVIPLQLPLTNRCVENQSETVTSLTGDGTISHKLAKRSPPPPHFKFLECHWSGKGARVKAFALYVMYLTVLSRLAIARTVVPSHLLCTSKTFWDSKQKFLLAKNCGISSRRFLLCIKVWFFDNLRYHKSAASKPRESSIMHWYIKSANSTGKSAFEPIKLNE